MTDRDAVTPSLPSGSWRARCETTSPADYIWLSYSLFFFIEPVMRGRGAYWMWCVLVYVPFAVAYVLLVRERRLPVKLGLLAAMAVLGLVGYTFNGGATSMLTLATAFLPFVVEDVVTILLCFAAAAGAMAAVGALAHQSWINTGIGFFLIAVVGSSNIFIGQRKRANARLSMAQDEIERLAALAERERIARDMHDVLGHTLSVIVLKSELAGRLLERDPEAAAREIADVEGTARKALAEVREAIGGYRARGLGAEVEQARHTLATAGVALRVEMPALLELSPTEETVLSLAVREAVTNVIRHARATRCELRLQTNAGGGHRLTLADDGRGMVAAREGNGLRGMRERVEALGGEFGMRSAGLAGPGGLAGQGGGGMTLELRLPAAGAAAAADRMGGVRGAGLADVAEVMRR